MIVSIQSPGIRRGLDPAGPLGTAALGVVPIIWNNRDLPDLNQETPADVMIEEISRLGFDGCQLGPGFPSGEELRATLQAHGLRLAEIYVSLPCRVEGPEMGALDVGRAALAGLVAAGGDVLVAALTLSPDRIDLAGRATAPGTPGLSDAGWAALGRLLDTLAGEAQAVGRRVAFHPHAGTFVETPAEVDRLLASCDPARVGLCLDTGHYTVGGGDPVDALRRYGERVTHVHLKDVAPEPLADLRSGKLEGFLAALRARIFTELGAGVLDLPGALATLAGRHYGGWLILEQDTTWRPPSESAAISRGVLEYALRAMARAMPS